MREQFADLSAARGELSVPASVTVERDFQRPRGSEYSVFVEFAGLSFDGHGADAFWALQRAREQYEPLGWRLAVQGASERCFPSGMLGEAGGWYVYRYPAPPGVGGPEAVSTFAVADPNEIVSVAEQQAAQKRRMSHLRHPSRETTRSRGGSAVREDERVAEDLVLSQAILEYLGKGRSPVPRNDHEAVRAMAGVDGEALLVCVCQIVAEVMTVQVDWSKHTLPEGGRVVRQIMSERHPELNDDALEALYWMFTYNWR